MKTKKNLFRFIGVLLALALAFSCFTIIPAFAGDDDQYEVTSVIVSGNAEDYWDDPFLNGQNWAPYYTENSMEQVETNIWEISYHNLDSRDDYQIIFSLNNSGMDQTLGSDSEAVTRESGKAYDAVWGGSNITFEVEQIGSTLTIQLDLTEYNPATGVGGKYTITVTPPQEPVEEPTTAFVQEPTQLVEEPTTTPVQEPTQPSDDGAIAAWDFDSTGKNAGDKLKEYGNSDGYAATTGEGTLFLSVSGTGGRALEWSDAEYGAGGDQIVPIMAAGSKNPWGSNPYIQITVDTTGYTDLELSASFAGSNKAPANWQLSYSTDGETFTDVDGAAFTITPDNRKILTAYFDELALPEGAENAGTLTLRLTPTSTTTVNGGSYPDTPTGGEIAINNIKLTGTKSEAPADVIIGDINGDTSVDVLDAVIIHKYAVDKTDLTDEQKYVADVNNDGIVDILDALDIQKFAVDKIDEFTKKS